MKDIKLLCLFLCCSTCMFAQISTTSVPERPKIEPPRDLQLDRNFQGAAVKRYLGQTLYVNGVSESLRKFAYEGFYKDSKAKKVYKKVGSSVVGRSDYDSLVGRYFEVAEILDHEWFNTHVLKLKDKNNGEVVYFRYSTKYEHTFPFLVVSFFEGIKEEYVGHEVVFTAKAKRSINFFSPEDQGLDVAMQQWTCVDLTVEEKNFELSLVLSTEDGVRAYVPYDRLQDREKGKREIFLKAEAEKYAEQFGETAWQTILEGKVRAGFTEEMVLLAWGRPEKVNRSSFKDQWVYDSQYLYFERGIMTSFN